MAEKVEFELVAKTSGAVDAVDKVDKAVKKISKSTRKASKELSGLEQAGGEVVKGLDRLTGGLASKFVAVGKAAKLSGKAMKTALISSGIGLAVVALALIVEYWDEISSLVDGVSGEQEKALQATKDTLAAQEKQLNTISQSENILKLQGKTEKEILDMKRQVTDESIANTKILLEQQKQQKKSQVEAAERNQKIAAGIIAFVNLPLTLILGMVDAITLGLSYLPGMGDIATSLAEDFTMGIASMVFDPEQVKDDGDKTIEATEEALLKLENTRAGYLVKDKEDRKKSAEDIKNAEIQAEKDKAAAIERIRKGLIDTEAEERAEKLRLIKQDFDEQIKLAEQYYGEESDKVKELKAAQKLAEDAQQKVFDDQDKAIEDQKTKKAQERREKKLQSENAISISKKRFAAEEIQDELLRLEKLKEIDLLEAEQETARLQAIVDNAADETQAKIDAQIALDDFTEQSRQTNLTRDKEIADASTEISETEADAKIAALDAYAAIAMDVSNLLGKETAAGKALSVAAATISTYTSATKAYESQLAIATPDAPVRAALAAGVAVATGLANVKKILSVKVPGQSSPTGGLPSATNAPTPPAFNIVGASGETQLADAIGSQTQRPARAFVVSSDVTTAQELDRNIIEGASI